MAQRIKVLAAKLVDMNVISRGPTQKKRTNSSDLHTCAITHTHTHIHTVFFFKKETNTRYVLIFRYVFHPWVSIRNFSSVFNRIPWIVYRQQTQETFTNTAKWSCRSTWEFAIPAPIFLYPLILKLYHVYGGLCVWAQAREWCSVCVEVIPSLTFYHGLRGWNLGGQVANSFIYWAISPAQFQVLHSKLLEMRRFTTMPLNSGAAVDLSQSH